MRYYISILLILIFPHILFAATINTADYGDGTASRANVAAAIEAATYGDTVTIPACAAGACVWTSGITITKDIHIVGAGQDSTYLTHNFTANSSDYEGFFMFHPDATARANLDSLDEDTSMIEVTGIHFYYATTPVVNYTYGAWVYNLNTPVVKRVRIHHNKFTNIYKAFWAKGYVHGLFDNNTLVDTAGGGPDGYNSGHWTNDIRTIGTAAALYYEDNVFSFPNRSGWYVFSQNNHGSSMVLRYNTVNAGSNGGYWETHCPASQFTEVYGNQFVPSYTQEPQLRSGIGIVYMNQGDGRLVLRREYSDVVTWAVYSNEPPTASTCAYPLTYNPHTGTSPQICNDSIDAGTDCYCSKINHSYFWNNRNSGGTLQTNVVTEDMWNTDASPEQSNTGVGDITHPELVENREYFTYTGSFDGTDAVGGTNGMGCGTEAQRDAITPTLTNAGFWVTTQNNCASLTGYIGAHATRISGTLYRWNGSAWVSYYTPYGTHPLRTDDESPPELTVTVTNTGSGHSPSHDGARTVQTGGTLTFTSGVYNGWKVAIAGTCGCTTDGCTVTPTENCTITCTSSEIQLMPW